MQRYLIILAFVLIPGTVFADVASITPAADNTLYSENNNSSNGAGQFLFTGATLNGFARRGLLRFDIAEAVPAGSTITGVSLTLHMSKTISGPLPVSLRVLQTHWGEGTSDATSMEGAGAQAALNDATWRYRLFSTEEWAAPGGDFNSTSSAATDVSGVGFYSWSSLQMIADVQNWFGSPATNFGWLLLGNEAQPGTAKRFDSKEGVPSFRPVLTITFTPPASSKKVPSQITSD